MRFAPELEGMRCTDGQMGTTAEHRDFGSLFVPFKSATMFVIACAAGVDPNDPNYRWDHVSVSLPNRCPNWEEMCRVKSLFWRDDETVLQFHPAASDYVNIHPHCLHLWREVGENHQLPPKGCV